MGAIALTFSVLSLICLVLAKPLGKIVERKMQQEESKNRRETAVMKRGICD